MTKLRETLERHGFELRKDKCTAYYPTPERADCIREEMTQFLKPHDIGDGQRRRVPDANHDGGPKKS